jgi:hypothetical protein
VRVLGGNDPYTTEQLCLQLDSISFLIEYMSQREKATTQSPLRTCEYDPNALVWGTSGDRRSYCLTWFQVPKEWVKENALLYLHLQHCFNKAVQLPV